jgi:glutaminase
MHSCGMYENSGVFAYKNGVPVKSSISGAIMFVIPGVGGICTYSPKLDSLNSSVRGINYYSIKNAKILNI